MYSSDRQQLFLFEKNTAQICIKEENPACLCNISVSSLTVFWTEFRN